VLKRSPLVVLAFDALESAAIEEPLRATLRMLRKLTREHAVDAEDMRAVLAAGASREQVEDALAVSFAFNTTDRLADAFKFFVPGPKAFEAGAKFLLARTTTADHSRFPLCHHHRRLARSADPELMFFPAALPQ
jgi:hypothetical protein